MNLTIKLTDEQAAEIKAALLNAEPKSAPALPNPPEGFHPAMMGPIKGGSSSESIEGVAMRLENPSKWDTGKSWGGSLSDSTYALRIGSEIARLNGLGLKLELGKTYATNAGEIVNPLRHALYNPPLTDRWLIGLGSPKEWNSIGQALIDGVAQPLSHQDSIKEEIPSELLPLPKLPDGFKEWRARGYGTGETSGKGEWVAGLPEHTGEGRYEWVHIPSSATLYWPSRYYLEAIPADKPEPEPEPKPRKAREWKASVNRENGQLYPYHDEYDSQFWEPGIRVREILPGEPTRDHVNELVEAFSEFPSILQWLKMDAFIRGYLSNESEKIERMESALAPFRKP